MKFNFKKIMSVVGACMFVGASIGGAVALSNTYPTPFVTNGVSNVAIVYGTNADSSDLTAATKINTHLLSLVNPLDTVNIDLSSNEYSGNFSSALGITEDEIALGELLIPGFLPTLTDKKIPTLIDDEIDWEGEDYDVHEEILLGDMQIQTTLDNNELESTALTNDEDLKYKYVFDDEINIVNNWDDVDSFTISILGQDYDVEEFDDDSITVSTSQEKILKIGESITIDGVVLTVEDIFDNTIQINNVLINNEKTKTVDGIEVKINSVAYSYDDSRSKVILTAGKEISTTYSDRDDYVDRNGEETDWEWSIQLDPSGEQFIGVNYIESQTDEDDDLVYEGGSYDFPENYASVQFEGLTDVSYGDFKLSFDDGLKMDGSNLVGDVVILEGPEEDSFVINSIIETDTIAYHYNGTYNLYYLDEDTNDFDLVPTINSTKLVKDDTNFDVVIDLNYLVLWNLNEEIVFDITNGTLGYIGTTSLGDVEQSDSTDIVIYNNINPTGKEIGKKDNNILTHSGIIIENPEDNLEDDEVSFSVPSETVFAKVSVVGQGQEIISETSNELSNETIVNVPTEVGTLILKDTEVASFQDKNLIVVGGSCINSVAAKLLGSDVPVCGTDFTALTNAGPGQYFLDQFDSPYNSEKVALLVAGYNAGNTGTGVDTLLA